MTVRLTVVTSECHVERPKDSNSTEGFEAGLNGIQLRVSGGVSTLSLGREGSSFIRREFSTVLSALLNGIDHTGGTKA